MTDPRSIPRGYSADERTFNEKFDALYAGQRAKAERGEDTGTAWRANDGPLARFAAEVYGAPAEVVDRGDDPAMSGAWLRLDDRTRQDCESPIPQIKQAAQKLLRQYAEAVTDPGKTKYDPIAAHFLEMARAAPRSAPPVTTPTMPVAEEAWIRARDEDRPYGSSINDRAHELEAEIIAERAAAAAEEEAE